MIKVIGSAILGYVVTAVLVIALMTLAWQAVGASGAFQPGVWEVTLVWCVLLLLAGLVAAVSGGYVTAAVSPDRRAVFLLMAIVVLLGLYSAITVLLAGDSAGAPLPRPDDLPMLDAMQNGRQPVWVALLNPVVGIAGVLLGARLHAQRGR